MKRNGIRKKIAMPLCLLLMGGLFLGGREVRAAQASAQEQTADYVSTTVEECAEMLFESVPEPNCGSVGGEWTVFGLARFGKIEAEEWFAGYYERLEAYVESCEGVLHAKKYTEYSRVILALTAMGKDPSDVAGYNLLTPLADYEQTVFQGINGPIFALLALDSGNYEIPQNVADSTQATRELYVKAILNQELADGGWALTGDQADMDITAMALQALAKYQDEPEVADAVERALEVLSKQQNDNGGYFAYDAESSETISQVITALAELDVDLHDERFVKNGKTLLDRLMEFHTEDCGFSHLPEDDTDLMATEQAFYALVALDRMYQGESSLYTMAE